MATIQFLAGNPRKGKKAKKKAVKKVAKKGKRKPMSAADRKAFAERMAKARGVKGKKKVAKKVTKKASRKITKKKNPRVNVYADKKGKAIYGQTVSPTAREAILIRKQYDQALKNAQRPQASNRDVEELRKWKKMMDDAKEDIKAQLDEVKKLAKKGIKKVRVETQEDSELKTVEGRLKANWKAKDLAKKKAFSESLKKKQAKAVKKKAKKAKKKVAKKTVKKSQQGEKIVAKRRKKASKKASRKVVRKPVSKKVSKKKVSKKKASRKGKGKKKASRRGKRPMFSFKGSIRKLNPSVEAITGLAPAELAGLAAGGFSYGAINDLAKRYLPQSVAKVIAKAGPVSGAVVPAALGLAILAVSKKYLSGKSYQKHVEQFAKGIVASSVVAAGASLYEIAGQPQLQKLIAPKGVAPLAGYEDEIGAIAHDEFGAVADDEFGDVDDFGAVSDDEFGDAEEFEGELNEWNESENDSDSTY